MVDWIAVLECFCVLCGGLRIFSFIRRRMSTNGAWDVYQCTGCKRATHLEPGE